MTKETAFTSLPDLAAYLRRELETKNIVLLYAFNGTGKTRLSMEFKNLGKQDDSQDTLYFNAFTEDLFTWDNDLDGDSDRKLKINSDSHFFDGLAELEMDTRIRPLLQRYADFDFRIDTEEWVIRFSRTVNGQTVDNIKVSRGEENIFIWCFFLAIVQLVLDGAEAYRWVKYIYIDDPISSLDEENAILVGNHLAQFLKRKDNEIKTVVSSHHTLFFNVLWNELKKASHYFLSHSRKTGKYSFSRTNDTPFFYHLALLQEIWRAKEVGQLHTYHFNALRSLLEKSAIFHGYEDFFVCVRKEDGDPDETLYRRLVNILSHGNYSFHDPVEMLPENREHFEKLLTDFLNFYPFNQELLVKEPEQVDA
ncbi:MAG: AAA family ATPase [Telmatospirillum sp.]|nr:AAA family ATPase [Telmatospirillum sp.]